MRCGSRGLFHARPSDATTPRTLAFATLLVHGFPGRARTLGVSDVFQASPSHTVVSALCTRFWVEMPLGLSYATATTRTFLVVTAPGKGEDKGKFRWLSVSLSVSHHKWSLSALPLYREGRALHTQHTEQHRAYALPGRAWGRRLKNPALPLRARPAASGQKYPGR